MKSPQRALGSVKGIVTPGDSRGKSMGFPTANIRIPEDAKIENGVYAVRIKVSNKTYSGIANVGYAPTFGRKARTAEVHIFDFDQDVYGKKIDIFFVQFLRPEKKFSSVEELKRQIARDVEKAKLMLDSL